MLTIHDNTWKTEMLILKKKKTWLCSNRNHEYVDVSYPKSKTGKYIREAPVETPNTKWIKNTILHINHFIKNKKSYSLVEVGLECITEDDDLWVSFCFAHIKWLHIYDMTRGPGIRTLKDFQVLQRPNQVRWITIKQTHLHSYRNCSAIFIPH